MTTDRKPPPSRTADQFVLRFPDGMRDRIASLARENGRSMNAEIIARLEASFEVQEDTRAAVAPILEKLDALTRLVTGGQQLDIFADSPRMPPHPESDGKPPKKTSTKK